MTYKQLHNPFRVMKLPIKLHKNKVSRKWDLCDCEGVIIASGLTKTDAEITLKALNYIEKTIPYLTHLLSGFVATESFVTPRISADISEIKERDGLVTEATEFLIHTGIISQPPPNYTYNLDDWAKSLNPVREEEVPAWVHYYHILKNKGLLQ